MSDAAAAVDQTTETADERDKIIVETRVREMISRWEHAPKVSVEFIYALDSLVENIIGRAVERCRQNGRKTLKSQDV